MRWTRLGYWGALLAMAVLPYAAMGAVTVVQHTSGYAEPNDYVVYLVDPNAPWITIVSPSDPNTGPYWFECYDDSTGDPATIGAIVPDPNLAGDVQLIVAGESWPACGASDVNVLRFDPNSGAHLTVVGLRISGVLGSTGYDTLATSLSTGLMTADSLGSDLCVHSLDGGMYLEMASLAHGFYVTSTGTHHGSLGIYSTDPDNPPVVDIAGPVNGHLTLGDSTNDDIEVYGTFHVAGSLDGVMIDGPFGGELSVDGDLGVLEVGPQWPWVQVLNTATIHVGGDLPVAFIGGLQAQAMTIGGDLGGMNVPWGMDAGTFSVAGNVGTLEGFWVSLRADFFQVKGNVDSLEVYCANPSGGRFEFGGDVTEFSVVGTVDPNELSIAGSLGTLYVDGDVTGPIEIGTVAENSSDSAVFVAGTLYSEIRIDGGLPNRSGNEPEIYVAAKTADAAITIDWDGFDPNDLWEQGAIVQVGQQVYYGQDTDNLIYDVTCLKGDMNNDRAVDVNDIDPFVEALGSLEAYGQDWPGLFGSGLYHADCDCSGVLDRDDCDAFVLRLWNPEVYYDSYPGCELCPQQENSGQRAGGESGLDTLNPQDVALGLAGNVAPQRYDFLVWLAGQLADDYAGTPRGAFWAQVQAALP